MKPAVQERCREIMGWVEECIHGLGYAPRDLPVTATWDIAIFKQAVLFETWDIEGRDRSETQDRVLERVKQALMQGCMGVRVRNGDDKWGWHVIGAKDLSEDQSVDKQGKRLYEPSMPKYAVWIEWRGPKPETWPHMMHMGQAENALSYPVGYAPTWN